MNLKDTENIFFLGIFLGVICAVATGIMAFTAFLTKAPIEANMLAKTNQSLGEALPDFDNQPSLNFVTVESPDDEKIPVTFYGAKKGGRLVAVAGLSHSMKGYGGRIEAMAGLGTDGKVKTVIITQQNETPGLGTNICDRKRQVTIFNIFSKEPQSPAGKVMLPPNPVLDQFSGHAANSQDSWTSDWKVKKDGGGVDYVTGATVTTRAVTDVVCRIAKTYAEKKIEIDKKLSESDK